MAITRKEKEAALAALIEDLKQAQGVVFTEYKGLTVKDADKVRKMLRKENVKYQVTKLTLLKKALAETGIGEAELKFDKPIALATSSVEATAPARLLKSLNKEFPNLVMDGGIFEHTVVGKDIVMQLASLPSKQELLGQFVSVLLGSLRELVTVLSGNVRGLMNVLTAMSRKKVN